MRRTVRVISFDELSARVSALPWFLYQSEHLAAMRADLERDGFYVGMLKDDLQKQRYAYEVSLVPQDVDWSVASEALFALLNDFNHLGYDRDPAALVCDFADTLLDELVDANEVLLELHSLPEEYNRAKSSRRFGRPSVHERNVEAQPSLGFIPRWSALKSRSDVVQVATEADRPPAVIRGRSIQRGGVRVSNRANWQKAVKDLRQVDEVKMIGTNMERLSWKGYAFAQQVATQNLAVATVTAPLGWDARGTFSEAVTSPYLMYRRLRFVRFWVEVVEDAVTFLNTFTGSPSLYGDGAFTFSLSGLPTTEDLTNAMQAVRRGSLTVEAAHTTYLFPKYAKRRSEPEEVV
jgi:hypothetical protein